MVQAGARARRSVRHTRNEGEGRRATHTRPQHGPAARTDLGDVVCLALARPPVVHALGDGHARPHLVVDAGLLPERHAVHLVAPLAAVDGPRVHDAGGKLGVCVGGGAQHTA